MPPASSKARCTSPGTGMGIQPSSSKFSSKAPARTPSPGAKSLSSARSNIEFAPPTTPCHFRWNGPSAIAMILRPRKPPRCRASCRSRRLDLRHAPQRQGVRGRRSLLRLLSVEQVCYVARETDFGVVLWSVADDLPCVGDAPEFPGVVRDAVEDVERDAVLVFYIRRLDRLAEELLHVPLADIAGELPDVAFGWLVFEEGRVDLPRYDDPELDYLELPSKAAAGVEEPQRLVGGLGPAVEVVRPWIVLGIYSVLEPRVEWVLVPFRGLVRARRDHPPDPLLQRELVDALHHVHVATLALVLRAGIVAIRLEPATVANHVHLRE